MPRIFVAALALMLPVAAQDPEIHKVNEAGVTPPRIIHKVQPKYSKEARKNKVEGSVSLSIIVGSDGKPRDISVKKSLDEDLDRNAIAAVQEWVFKPATKKNGEPVAVYATVEVTFHLLDP